MRENKQSGQTVVFVAIALLVVIAFVALSVDVGNVWGQRRRMQNAADAGALAGAREICFGNPGAAEARAMEYAVTRNEAESASMSRTGGYTVTVVTTETVETYFGGVIGFGTIDVTARASAMCGRARSGSGLWPVAFDVDTWDDLYADSAGCGEEFYVWTSDKIVDCDVDDCDFDNDGRDDVVVGGNRGYLDFSGLIVGNFQDPCVQPGCGANELACQFRNDSGGYLELPECVPGVNGVKASVKDDVDSRIGDTVRVPLFDGVGCSGTTQCAHPNGVNYWVTAFGCVRVHGWVHHIPGFPGEKAIEVSIDCGGCQTSSGGTDGEIPNPWELRAVSLTE